MGEEGRWCESWDGTAAAVAEAHRSWKSRKCKLGESVGEYYVALSSSLAAGASPADSILKVQ